MTNNHSRPLEKLPQGVFNLLVLYSMDAYWDGSNVQSTLCGWRIMKRSSLPMQPPPSASEFVYQYSTIHEWIAAVKRLEDKQHV